MTKMRKKAPVRIIRLDPYKMTIASLPLMVGVSHSTKYTSKILKSDKAGFRELMVAENGVKLAVFAALDLERPGRGFRLPGMMDPTLGYAFLGGIGPGGGLTDVPVGTEWAKKRVRWLDLLADGTDVAL